MTPEIEVVLTICRTEHEKGNDADEQSVCGYE